jgi:hypothetical protein
MDNFLDEDIEIFCINYKQNIVENPLLNAKIPIWVEYLKTKKHYRENGMDEDPFFKKRFRINNEDLLTIHKLIDRIKRGKTLTKVSKSNIMGTCGSFGSNIYGDFNENENYDDVQPKFELMGEVNSALDAYNKKMKKHSQKHKWKQSTDPRVWDPQAYGMSSQIPSQLPSQIQSQNTMTRSFDPIGCVQDEPDRYYTEDMYSTRPQVEFDVQDFARTQMFNMGKTNIIQQIDQINDILDSNNLITNEFDTEYKRSVPVINSKKKVSFTNHIDQSIGNNNLTGANRADWKFSNGMVSGLEQGIGGPNHYAGSPEASRLWQDVDLLAGRGLTRKPSIENRNSFEHQFQYLDGNYNRVPDPRIIGTSSRTENRSTFKR